MNAQAEMTPVIFKKIKNILFNDYALTKRGRLTYLLGTSCDELWQRFGEKLPFSNNLNLSLQDKTDILFERMEYEQSPRRFVELCQAVAEHITYVCCLPSTSRKSPMDYREDVAGVFLGDVYRAFVKVSAEKLLHIDSKEEFEITKYSVDYLGNDLAQKESEQILINGFESKRLIEIIARRKLEAATPNVFKRALHGVKLQALLPIGPLLLAAERRFGAKK